MMIVCSVFFLFFALLLVEVIFRQQNYKIQSDFVINHFFYVLFLVLIFAVACIHRREYLTLHRT